MEVESRLSSPRHNGRAVAIFSIYHSMLMLNQHSWKMKYFQVRGQWCCQIICFSGSPNAAHLLNRNRIPGRGSHSWPYNVLQSRITGLVQFQIPLPTLNTNKFHSLLHSYLQFFDFLTEINVSFALFLSLPPLVLLPNYSFGCLTKHYSTTLILLHYYPTFPSRRYSLTTELLLISTPW